MKKLILNNIPNFLSGYRILAVPPILYCIFTGQRDAFFILLMINLVTDILDGLIARTFKLQTEFGAKLDSTADLGTYLCAITGFLVLEQNFIQHYVYWFYCMILLYVLPQLTSFIRFKRNTHFHLYSSKLTGYLQGFFVLFYYLNFYVESYFYFMMVFSYLAYIESFIITLRIPQLRSNVQGIYFMLKKHKRIA